MLVVAKIEKDTALANIGSIVDASDAVMVARGDLGVELPFEEVPIAQKRIIALCNALGRPVITATQMLESMITNPRPTRAEASDVANAILDGTDAVMLSAETAAGQYPRLAVEAMTRIIIEIERRPLPHVALDVPRGRRWARRDGGRDRRRDDRRRALARRAARRRVHEERIQRAHRRVAPAGRADPRAHRLRAHVSAARARVGRGSGARAALRDVRGDVRARARQSSSGAGSRTPAIACVVTAGVPVRRAGDHES